MSIFHESHENTDFDIFPFCPVQVDDCRFVNLQAVSKKYSTVTLAQHNKWLI